MLLVMDAAVLLEAGWEDLADETWVVIVPPDTAVERAVARDGLDAEAVRKRIASQLSNDERSHGRTWLSTIPAVRPRFWNASKRNTNAFRPGPKPRRRPQHPHRNGFRLAEGRTRLIHIPRFFGQCFVVPLAARCRRLEEVSTVDMDRAGGFEMGFATE